MQLYESNRLSLTDPVSKWLDEDYFVNFTKSIKTRQALSGPVTLQNLLTHSSPLSDVKAGFNALHLPQSQRLCSHFGATEDEKGNDVDALNEWTLNTLNALKNYGKFEIGKVPKTLRCKYSHFNMAMLGEVIRNSNGMEMSFAEFIADSILHPLGMKGCGFVYDKYDDDHFEGSHVASGHIHQFGLFVPRLRWQNGSNLYHQLVAHRKGTVLVLNEFEMDSLSTMGLIGNTEEFALFLQSQLRKIGGNGLEGKQSGILREETLSMMQDNQLYGGIGIESKYAQGFGWKIGIENEHNDDVVIRFLNHEGYGPGFSAEMRIYPDDDCGVVALCNYSPSTKKGIFKLMHQLIHSVFKCQDVIELHLETQRTAQHLENE